MTQNPKQTVARLEVEPHASGDIPQYGTYAGELYVLATPGTIRMIKIGPELLEALKASRAILKCILGTDLENIIIAEQVAVIDAALAKAGACL